MLELALTPYDVLRLRRATQLRSAEVLEKYIIVEQDTGEPFPRFYLTMVDDGQASCVFVSPEGCSVYPNRPGACRSYPLGRAATRVSDNTITESFILMKEKHCCGFSEPNHQNAVQYSKAQGLDLYNNSNDSVAQILQHESIRQGFVPSPKQVELFTLAIYNIDTFRDLYLAGKIKSTSSSAERLTHCDTDEQLLKFSISWLKQQLFNYKKRKTSSKC
jgi:Fe-S-cluster containining protein